MPRVHFSQWLLLATVLSITAAAQQSPQPQRAPEQNPGSAASIGLLLDNSKSMATKRDAMVAAMHLLVEASTPQDQFFVVNFNEKPQLDQSLTGDRKLISSAIDKAEARGATALYDAIATSAAYLNKATPSKKRVLVVVADHGDNMSHISSKQLLQDVEGPVMQVSIYCIGLFDPGDDPQAAQLFRQLTKQTGGAVLFVPKPKKLNQAAQQLAHELQKQEADSGGGEQK
jgi:Ca-activated chloride channel homolog